MPLIAAVVVALCTVALGVERAAGAAESASPDRIAYSVGAILPGPDLEGHSQVYTVNADGSDSTQLTHVEAPVQAGDPAWSPDGKQIAYVSNATGRFQVWVMNADGSRQHRLVRDNPYDAFTPRWSPDASRLLFTRCSQPFGFLECTIATVAADGSGLADRTSGHWVEQSADWAPDGASIVFDSNREGLVSAIWRLDLGTGALRRITPAAPEAFYPAYRHDGQRILFGNNGFRPHSRTYTMNPDGSDVRLVLRAPKRGNSIFARWSPDDQQVVYATGRTNGLFLSVANADGTGAHDIVETGDLTLADWGPTS